MTVSQATLIATLIANAGLPAGLPAGPISDPPTAEVIMALASQNQQLATALLELTAGLGEQTQVKLFGDPIVSFPSLSGNAIEALLDSVAIPGGNSPIGTVWEVIYNGNVAADAGVGIPSVTFNMRFGGLGGTLVSTFAIDVVSGTTTSFQLIHKFTQTTATIITPANPILILGNTTVALLQEAITGSFGPFGEEATSIDLGIVNTVVVVATTTTLSNRIIRRTSPAS